MISVFPGQITCQAESLIWLRQNLAAARVVAGPDRLGMLVLYEPGERDALVVLRADDLAKLIGDEV